MQPTSPHNKSWKINLQIGNKSLTILKERKNLIRKAEMFIYVQKIETGQDWIVEGNLVQSRIPDKMAEMGEINYKDFSNS